MFEVSVEDALPSSLWSSIIKIFMLVCQDVDRFGDLMSYEPYKSFGYLTIKSLVLLCEVVGFARTRSC